jgi:hypothetical protein
MQHSKSIKFATAIAVKKKKDQPDVPISATEIMVMHGVLESAEWK